jgi:hypothetical protein
VSARDESTGRAVTLHGPGSLAELRAVTSALLSPVALASVEVRRWSPNYPNQSVPGDRQVAIEAECFMHGCITSANGAGGDPASAVVCATSGG